MITRLILTFLVLTSSTAVAQIGSDYFHPIAQRSHAGIVDIAIAGESLYLLTAEGLATVDLRSPGGQLQSTQGLRIAGEYDRLQSNDDELWLWSYSGRLARIINSVTGQLQLLDLGTQDSILSLTRAADHLIAARGFEGLSTHRIAADELLKEQRIDRGVHYTEVASNGTIVAAIDDFNGIELYLVDQDTLLFQDELLSQSPLRFLALTETRIVAGDGSNRLQVWGLNPNSMAAADESIELPFRLAGMSKQGTDIYLAGKGGEIAVLPDGASTVAHLQTSGLAAVRIATEAFSGISTIVALDPLSNVTALDIMDGQLARTRLVTASDLPLALEISNSVAIMSTTSGIFELYPSDDELIPFALWQRGMGLENIVSTESRLFATSASQKALLAFNLRSDRYSLISSESLPDAALALRVVGSADGETVVAVALPGSIEFYRYDSPHRAFTLLWSAFSDFPISLSDVSASAVVTISAVGELQYQPFEIETGVSQSPITARVDPSPTSIKLINSYIAVGYADKLVLYWIDFESGAIEHFLTPLAIRSAYTIDYDSDSDILVIGGLQGVHFVDFSDPDRLGVVYSIPNTSNVFDIRFSIGKLLASSRNSIQLFESGVEAPGGAVDNSSISGAQFQPNPFNTASEIRLSLSAATIGKPISYEIVNVLGQRVWRESRIVAGSEERFRWSGISGSGAPSASGVYFFRATVENEVLVRKLVYLK